MSKATNQENPFKIVPYCFPRFGIITVGDFAWVMFGPSMPFYLVPEDGKTFDEAAKENQNWVEKTFPEKGNGYRYGVGVDVIVHNFATFVFLTN